jgi:hypothetical protein
MCKEKGSFQSLIPCILCELLFIVNPCGFYVFAILIFSC